MHVDVVVLRLVAVHDHVVAGGRVVLVELHLARAGGYQLGTAAGEDVLPLMRVARAARAEARARLAVIVPAADREDVPVEVEGVAAGVRVARAPRVSAGAVLSGD